MSNIDQPAKAHGKEHKILVALRKTLGAIVRDTTPQPGIRHPLTEKTIEDIRACFGLIAAREKELANQDQEGAEEGARMRPHYTDEPREAASESVITFKKKPHS